MNQAEKLCDCFEALGIETSRAALAALDSIRHGLNRPEGLKTIAIDEQEGLFELSFRDGSALGIQMPYDDTEDEFSYRVISCADSEWTGEIL